MKTAVCFLIMGFLFCLFPHDGVAEPELKVALSPSQGIHVGRTGQLHVKMKWKSSEGDYFFTQPSLELENLAVEEVGESNETFEDWKEKTFIYTLKATRAGAGKIHPFRIGYTQATEQETRYMEGAAIEIRISPDRRIFFQILWIGLGLATIAGVILAGWAFLKSSQAGNQKAPISEPSLEEQYLPSFSDTSIQPLEAAKIFRRYLTEKYLLNHGGSTNFDILGQLEKKIQPDELKTLKKIFDKLDEYRFAGPSSSETDQQHLYREMIRFVQGKKII